MNDPIRAQLAEIAQEILEDAAFVFAEPAEVEPPGDGAIFVSRIHVAGQGSGSVLLAVEPAVAREIAANLLALDPADPEAAAKSADAVGEVLNMISGALSVRCSPPGLPMRFSTPVTEVLDGASVRLIDLESRGSMLTTDLGARIWTAMLPGPVSASLEPRA
ncbi:MAG: chemotaxis protein CheX [Deltaproteobacteria bacterium]|nr:chemotaxis protein CheX [Deltaproteobacteria bacterium]